MTRGLLMLPEPKDVYLEPFLGLPWGRPSSASWYDWTWASASAAAFLAASVILSAWTWAVSSALFSEAPSPNDLSYSSTSAAAAKAASLAVYDVSSCSVVPVAELLRLFPSSSSSPRRSLVSGAKGALASSRARINDARLHPATDHRFVTTDCWSLMLDRSPERGCDEMTNGGQRWRAVELSTRPNSPWSP